MKKKLLYVSFIIFLFAIALNLPSFATFYISDFQIDANVNSSGDMQVKEKITYYTNENANGLTRKILTTNTLNKKNSASGMELLGVYVEGEPCEQVSYANIGDNMVYEYTTNGSTEYNIKLYSPFINQIKTIEYDYILKNVAVKYNDIGELYWNFIGKEWEDEIRNLTINITLPELAARSTSYVYGHGSDNGTFTKVGNKITLMASNLSKNQALDARILFEREAISDSTNIINKDVLKEYINEEEGFYSKQEESKIFGNFSIRVIAEFISIFIIVIWVITYILYDKEYLVEKEKYFRDIPYDLTPEMIQYLYYGKITNKSFYIGFLNLVKQGVFKLEERTNKVGKKVQTIIYNKDEKVKLSDSENSIKNTIKGFLLKDEINNEESIDMLTLSKKMEHSTGRGLQKYEEKLKTEKESLFDKPSKAPKMIIAIAIILMILIILIIGISASFLGKNAPEFNGDTGLILIFFLGMITLCYSPFFATVGSQIPVLVFLVFHCGCFQAACIGMMATAGVIWLYIPYVICFIFIQYVLRVKKYPLEEREAIEKIKGLRRYIKDYSLLREKDGIVENIALWEDYFIIAIALGLNSKTINYFYNYGKEQVNSNLGIAMHYTNSYSSFYYPMYNSFNSYQRSYSSSGSGSSYSGSSGGFSGGSSSGGGGGRRWRRRTLLKNEYKK